MSPSPDVVVIGAGFGGLGAALALAERGVRVVVLEAMAIPGGCASTFRRNGCRFDAGATLCSGFGPGQLFRRWIDRHRLALRPERLDPVLEIRTPDVRVSVPSDRDHFVASMGSMPGAPRDRLTAFFGEQAAVADTMWRLLDDPALLPPFSPAAVMRHLAAAPRYASLVRLAGRPLLDVLRRHGVDTFAPLRAWAESMSQITVQCGAAEAEAPVALATADYPFRGVAHLPGGVGTLADALVGAIRALGGDVRFATRVTSLRRERGDWIAGTNCGEIRAPVVVANLLPQALRRLTGDAAGAHDPLDRLARDVASGWGAAMLYLTARPPAGAAPPALHLDLTADSSLPYDEGQHVFVSISAADEPGRAPPGLRTMTVSTHVRMADLRAAGDAERAERVASIQRSMRETLERLAPEWETGITWSMTASPRTFERFTLRPDGLVGGVPRRAGLHNYRGLAPAQVRDGLWLAGDSVFPGQSALAAAIGGTRVAEAIVRSGAAEPAGAAR